MNPDLVWWVWTGVMLVAIGVDIWARMRLRARARVCNRWRSGTKFCTCSMCGPPIEHKEAEEK